MRTPYVHQRKKQPRKLNSYTRSPDGHCEWCMTPSEWLECPSCYENGVAVDASVKAEAAPTKKARCGHLSPNYFRCEACEVDELEDTKDLYNFCRSVQSFDLRKLGATNANGTISSSLSSANTRKVPSTIRKLDFGPTIPGRKPGSRLKGALGFSQVGDKFIAKIKVNGKCVHLGTFETEEEAHEAFNEKKQTLGEYSGGDEGSFF